MANYINRVGAKWSSGGAMDKATLEAKGLAVLDVADNVVTNDELRIQSGVITYAFLLMDDPGDPPSNPATQEASDYLRKWRIKTANNGVQMINPVVEVGSSPGPIIPGWLIVNLAGLGGSFSVYNGDHLLVTQAYSATVVDHHLDENPNDFIWINWYGGLNEWWLTLYRASGCGKTWSLSSTIHDPIGTYAEEDCIDDACAGSCGASLAAECKVKYAGTDWP